MNHLSWALGLLFRILAKASAIIEPNVQEACFQVRLKQSGAGGGGGGGGLSDKCTYMYAHLYILL